MKNFGLKVVNNLAAKSAQIFLYGIIGNYWSENPLTANAFVRSLTTLEGQGVKRVDVRLNGPGGDVWEGLGILNAILSSKMEIHTYNDGICASMHGVILSAPKDIKKRHGAKASVTMIHNASTLAWGNSKQMRETADFLDTHDSVLCGVFADATGQTIEAFQASYFDYADHWLTSKEASDLGLFEVEDYAAQDVPADIHNMSMHQVAALYLPATGDNNLSLFDKVKSMVNEIINPKTIITDMKFPRIEALVKVPSAELTEELVNAVKTELAEAGIEGVTIVLDSEQLTLAENAEKVPALEASVISLNSGVAELQRQLDAANALLNKPAEDSASAVAAGDTIQSTEAASGYNVTSVDREMARLAAEYK